MPYYCKCVAVSCHVGSSVDRMSFSRRWGNRQWCLVVGGDIGSHVYQVVVCGYVCCEYDVMMGLHHLGF